MSGWLRSVRSGPCVRRADVGRRRLVRSLRRRQHRRGAPARGRQSAQLPARHALRDRSAAGHRSVLAARSTTRRARTSTALRAQRAARGRGCAVALFLPAAHGRARADRHRRLFFGRRVRARRHQEARAHAPRQGRRPHAAHRRAARADGRRVPDLPRRRRRRRAARPATSAAPLYDFTAADGVQHTIWRAGLDADRRRWWTRSRGSRRSTSPTGITAPRARRARAPSWRRRRTPQTRREHVHRRRVSGQPGADPSLQPHREGSRRRARREQFLAALRRARRR